jgi:hypothetical protein
VTHFYDALAPVLGASNAIALLLLFFLLLRGPSRKFWVVLFYVSWELLATAGLTLADLHLNGTTQADHATESGKLYALLYWSNDVIVDLLRFMLVVVLIYKVVGTSRPHLGRILGGLVVAMIVLPFLIFHPIFQAGRWTPKGAWFNSTSQLLNFGAAIMNVILWGALIQMKRRDPQIVAVSVGLGILVTGTAISYGLRHFYPQGSFTAIFNLFLNLMQLAAWLIWCRGFWPPPKTVAGAAPASG